MDEEGKRGLKLFLEYWLLMGLLAAFNFYMYFTKGSVMFLVVGLVCIAAFVGWAMFYLFYVRKGER
jgi:hypothetical protein